MLDDVAEVALWSMGAEEAADTLTALTRQAARFAELKLRVAVHADTLHVGDAVAASSDGELVGARDPPGPARDRSA